MDTFYIIISSACLILIGVIILLLSCCRRMQKNKNRIIASRLREQDRIARELEHTRIEKDAYERLLRNKLYEQ